MRDGASSITFPSILAFKDFRLYLTGVIQLHTQRILLRAFRVSDSSEVQRMAGDPAVAATTLTIPHPYPDGAAETWISKHEKSQNDGETYTFAIEDKASSGLVGCISIDVTKQHKRGMLGYWIGKDFWNKGYCSEATKRLIQFAFEELNLVKVFAYHLVINPASGKVMEKAGMIREGFFQKHVIKDGNPLDCVYFGITMSSEYNDRK